VAGGEQRSASGRGRIDERVGNLPKHTTRRHFRSVWEVLWTGRVLCELRCFCAQNLRDRDAGAEFSRRGPAVASRVGQRLLRGFLCRVRDHETRGLRVEPCHWLRDVLRGAHAGAQDVVAWQTELQSAVRPELAVEAIPGPQFGAELLGTLLRALRALELGLLQRRRAAQRGGNCRGFSGA